MAAFVLGAAFFLSAAASTAQAKTMTQLEYLQFLTALSGDNLGPNPSASDYVNWARARGLNPSGGWQPGAKLSKDVVAETVAQMVGLTPRKGGGNYVALLAQNGIHVPNANQISRTDLTEFIDGGLAEWVGSLGSSSPSHPGHQRGRGHEIGRGKGHANHDHNGDGIPDGPRPGNKGLRR